MAQLVLPPMLGDPCHLSTSSTFFRDHSKLSRQRRERLHGGTNSVGNLAAGAAVSTGSLGARSASYSQLKSQSRSTVSVPLPPIMKAKRALTFEDMYSSARLRVAKKAAQVRKGGCAPHLASGPQLPGYPSGCYRKFDPFGSVDDEHQWAASVLDCVPVEQASTHSSEDFGADEVSGTVPSTVTATTATPDRRRGSAVRQEPEEERPNSRRISFLPNLPVRPHSQEAQTRMSRFASRESVHAMTAFFAKGPLDPVLADLLVALSARFTGLAHGLSTSEISRLRNAFDRFKLPGESEIYTADLHTLLNYLGHSLTGQDAIDQVVKEVTLYDYLDFDEYLNFMQRFYEYERAEFKNEFDKYDRTQSGEIGIPELRLLAKDLGFHPMRAMTEEAVNIIHGIDCSDQPFNFDEVCMCLAVYNFNEGFTTEEVKEMQRLFDRFSEEEGKTGTRLLPPGNLPDALVQFFGLEIQEFAEVLGEQLAAGQGLQRSSFDRKSGQPESITFREFLITSRKLRQQDYEKIFKDVGDMFIKSGSHGRGDPGDYFSSADEDGSGGISEAELRKILKSKHYTPLRTVLDEYLEQVYGDWDPEESELDFEEFYDFLTILNRRDGFLVAELAELREVYDRFDDDKSEEVSAMEIASLFRHVGYRVNLEDIRDDVALVDANGSGQLDFREFLRLMRLYREKELKKVKTAFHEMKDLSTDLMPLTMLDVVLLSLEHEAPYPDHAYKEDLSFDELVDLVDSCRSNFVSKERKKAGFSDEELNNFEAMFKRFDKDSNGTIDNKELQVILKEFGWQPRTRDEQQVLVQKLFKAKELAREAGAEDYDADDNTNVKFWSFVQLIRMLRTDQDKEEELQLQNTVKELSFSEGETEEFRQVFRTWVKKARELDGMADSANKPKPSTPERETISRDVVHRLIRSLGVIVAPDAKEILDKKITSLDDDGRIETAKIQFAGFLKLMRWILDTNFSNILGATSPVKPSPT